MPAPVLQVKRGALSNLPGLRAGEPSFTTDTFDFYVGIDSTTNNNKFVGSHRYWTKETSSVGSSVNLVEGTTNGSNYIALKSPDNLASTLTYTLPVSPQSDYYLKTDGSGNLSWATVTGSQGTTFSGIVTFTNTTDSTTKDNGAVVIDGGVGIEKSVNIGGNLSVSGISTFTNGPVLIGSGTSTGTSSQRLQVTGGAYVSGNLGIGTTNPTSALTVQGDVFVSDVVTATTFRGTNVNAKDGTSAITISNSTGNVGVSSNLTVNGNLYVIGTTTEVETTNLKVQDNLIDLGLVQSGNVLVPPLADLNIDIGVLLNWYDSGISTSKKAAIYWDDSVQRIGIASDVSEVAGVLTSAIYAPVEIGSLWVTDCAGTSQVISCTAGQRFLDNITVDAGTF